MITISPPIFWAPTLIETRAQEANLRNSMNFIYLDTLQPVKGWENQIRDTRNNLNTVAWGGTIFS